MEITNRYHAYTEASVTEILLTHCDYGNVTYLMAAACNLLVSTSAFHATCCSAKGLLEDVTLGDRNLHANYSYGSVWKEDRVGNFQDLVITKSYGF